MRCAFPVALFYLLSKLLPFFYLLSTWLPFFYLFPVDLVYLGFTFANIYVEIVNTK